MVNSFSDYHFGSILLKISFSELNTALISNTLYDEKFVKNAAAPLQLHWYSSVALTRLCGGAASAPWQLFYRSKAVPVGLRFSLRIALGRFLVTSITGLMCNRLSNMVAPRQQLGGSKIAPRQLQADSTTPSRRYHGGSIKFRSSVAVATQQGFERCKILSTYTSTSTAIAFVTETASYHKI